MEGANEQQFNPKIFTTGTERCPVRSFKLFESHCPEKAKAPSYPFFLAINHKGLQACGKKIANHSVQKTSISWLLDGGTTENFVAQFQEQA